MEDTQSQTFETTWEWITIRVTYTPNAYPASGRDQLEVRSIDPIQAALPVSETGYRSQPCRRETVTSLGGPLATAIFWLDEAAQSRGWKAADLARRQLSLF